MQKTIYNLTKKDCKTLTELYNTDQLALLLWNKCKVSTLDKGISRAQKIKKFAN